MESNHKKLATEFLQLVVTGDITQAYKKYVDMNGKHHNAFYPAGFPALQKGMEENHLKFPNKKFTIKNVIGDGDVVTVHSHVILQPKELEFSTMHLFRFQNGKIVEMWDIGQQVPLDSPNKDGLF
jgi:predicted SnoaL-like aldol condensation-catalyzing enzyme